MTDEGAQDVKMGLRTPEELGAKVTEDGEMIAATARPNEDAAPAEDWAALAAGATTKEEMVALGKRAMAAGEYKGATRSLLMARDGEITRELAAAGVEDPAVVTKRFLSGTVNPSSE